MMEIYEKYTVRTRARFINMLAKTTLVELASWRL